MHTVTQNLIEEIRNGDLRSAMDALRGLTKFAVDLQQQLITVKTELDKKINATSKYLDSPTTIELVGHGTISCDADSAKVIGVGTFFMKDISVGNLIKVGSLSRSVIGIDDDTHLTVDTIFNNPFSNYSYNVIRHQNKETFKGMFEFGELTHDTNNVELTNIPFKGNIAQNSYFTHYGRISDPYDLVNVRFVQNAVAPAMARALNAIQRDGDTIGRLTKKTNTNNLVDPYVYWYRNCSFKFTDQCSLDFTDSPLTVEHKEALVFPVNDIELFRDPTKPFVKTDLNPSYKNIYKHISNYGNIVEFVVDYSIRRTGDVIGPESLISGPAIFEYRNTNITFNDSVNLTYKKNVAKPTGLINDPDFYTLTPRWYVDEKATASTKFLGCFYNLKISSTAGSTNVGFSSTGTPSKSSNFDSYFQLNGDGYQAKVTCVVFCIVNIVGAHTWNGGDCNSEIDVTLQVGSSIVAEAHPHFRSAGGNNNNAASPSATLSAMVKLTAGSDALRVVGVAHTDGGSGWKVDASITLFVISAEG